MKMLGSHSFHDDARRTSLDLFLFPFSFLTSPPTDLSLTDALSARTQTPFSINQQQTTSKPLKTQASTILKELNVLNINKTLVSIFFRVFFSNLFRPLFSPSPLLLSLLSFSSLSRSSPLSPH